MPQHAICSHVGGQQEEEEVEEFQLIEKLQQLGINAGIFMQHLVSPPISITCMMSWLPAFLCAS